MSNNYFRFKQFNIQQEHCAMKVTTDGCLFGAWVAAKTAACPNIRQVLDIGTGTGLLSLMLAQKNDSVLIDAVEIDAAAAAQARQNVLLSPWHNRIHVHHTDIKDFGMEKQYDLIISNPPFYENEWSSPDAKRKTAHHESGLLLTELCRIIHQRLTASGRFALLLPYKRKNEILEMLADSGLGILEMVQVKQSVNHAYFRLLVYGGKKVDASTSCQIQDLAIRDQENKYTTAFTALLREYYLYL